MVSLPKKIGSFGFLFVCLCASLLIGDTAFAQSSAIKTDIVLRNEAVGSYINWDGVSNIAQFKGPDGNLWFAVDSDPSVTVYKTDREGNLSGSVTLEKQHPTFGTALCDNAGNIYLVTGEANPTEDTMVETVFVSKYDSAGNHIKTTGYKGSLSTEYDSFCTKEPFDGGCCDASISGGILTVHYARGMYSGHQSNNVFSVNIDDMSRADICDFYQSHSFAQRVVSTKKGFVYMSEGDCYDRAFTACYVELSNGEVLDQNVGKTFDFWVEDGTLDAYNMYILNNNFAHMGGIAALSDGRIAFVAQSAQSLNSNAEEESEEIFLQIFNPKEDLNTPGAYTTTGERSGLAGGNGRTEVTDYGVKWLTSYGSGSTISNVQAAVTEDDRIVVLYKLKDNEDPSGKSGLYSIVLDDKGNEIRPAECLARNARLNKCRMQVCVKG